MTVKTTLAIILFCTLPSATIARAVCVGPSVNSYGAKGDDGTATNGPGFKFTNVDIGAAPGLGQAAVQVRTGGSLPPQIEINGGSLDGPAPWIDGPFPMPAAGELVVLYPLP
jgi:hypothetical protein